jgi:murein tripeptide amidase MpaA
MLRRFTGLLVLLVVCLSFGQRVDYTGYQVVRAQVQTQAQLDLVRQLGIDVWTERVGLGALDLNVSPAQKTALRQAGIRFTVLIQDLQRNLDAQTPPVGPTGYWDAYQDLATITSAMQGYASSYPTLAQFVDLGTSIEGRHLYALRIGRKPAPNTVSSGTHKIAVMFFSGQHAREWIGPPTTMWLANQLLTRYGTEATVTNLLNNAEIIVVPVMNPDGYSYTWTNNRLWRKNRRNNGSGVYGVDLNRNWGYQWGGAGSSGSPSNEEYRGTAAFSEPETQDMRDFVEANPLIKGMMDIHSYGEDFIYPWDYTSAAPPDAAPFIAECPRWVKAVYNVHGISFTTGQGYYVPYPASGTSGDWGYGAHRIWATCVELRDTGVYGFTLPASQIIPTCEEMYAGYIEFAQFVVQQQAAAQRKR